VTEYARSLGLKVYDICAPAYATNYIGMQAPRKQDDGSFTLALPYDPERKVPVADMAEDFGKYVVGGMEHDVETVYAAPAYITPTQIAEELSKGECSYCFSLGRSRCRGNALATSSQWITTFLVVEITPPAIDGMGYGIYLLYVVRRTVLPRSSDRHDARVDWD
jgi:hypothetical protein